MTTLSFAMTFPFIFASPSKELISIKYMFLQLVERLDKDLEIILGQINK